MRLKLQVKIFAVFFLASMILIAFMVISLRYFMHRHFTEFVNRAELERHAPLRQALADEYQSAGGWDRLRADGEIWTNILTEVARERYARRQALSEEEADSGERANADTSSSNTPSPRQVQRFSRRLFLLDGQKQVLAGTPRPEGDAVLQEIMVNSRVVGWLGLRRRHSPRTPLEVTFIQQQYTLFYLLGGGLLLITALVSYLLSRHLLAPIKALTTGTKALTSRRFATRIDFRSKDELGQLADDFNIMAQTLEKYEQMRRQWMSDIAHELRTPLSVLRGEIEAIVDGVRQASPERLASLHSEVLHVSRIVEDLHALSLADSGSLAYRAEPVRPVAVLEEALAQFQSRLEGKQIRIDNRLGRDREIVITGDPDRLAQLFANLLENTVRYTDASGTLAVGQTRNSDHWTLWLEDSGPGVPAEALPRLFDRFFRVESSRNRAMGGSGLGLSICKTIVETMGGEIRAARGATGGLRMEIRFPLRQANHRNH